jgi:hypothetical protein
VYKQNDNWVAMCCELLKTVRDGSPISLDAFHTHWKRLSLDEANLVKEICSSLSLELKWK